jgi:uncharacterized membrane protein
MTIAIQPLFSKISIAVNWFKGSPPLHSRSAIIDELRAVAILNMIAYHFCYCAVKIYGADWSWFSSFSVGVWQEYICCSFLFIAGFCSRFSKRPYKRAFKIALCAFLITFATYLFNAKNFVIFGILHCMAPSMFIAALFSRLIEKIQPAFGAGVCLALALIVWNTTKGYFGFGDFSLALPAVLYETDAFFILGMKT